MSKFSPEAFRKACGDAGSLGVLAEQPKGPGARFSFLEQPFAIVGREKESDVILNDQRVSRRHAYLQMLNGAVFCVDLKARNGIHWQEGSRFAGWLGPMNSVRMGGCTLRLVAESAAASPFHSVNPLAAGCLEKPFVTLEFLNGRKNQAEWSVDRLLTLLGTSSWCKLRFPNSTVAPVHASLVCTSEGAWVVDLLSLTGIFLNGQKVRLARLEDKDELRIGDFAMRVRCQPVASLAMRTSPPAPLLTRTNNGIGRTGHITTVDFGPTANEISLAAPRQNTRALERFVDPSAKAMMESVFFPMVQQFSAVQDQMFDQFQQAMGLMFQMFGTMQKEQIEFLRAELDRVQNLTREIQALQLEMKGPAVGAPGLAGAKMPPFGGYRSTNGTPSVSATKRDGQHQGLPANGAPAGNSESNGTEVHAMLCERMAELQEDRRGRIKKMVDFLSGK